MLFATPGFRSVSSFGLGSGHYEMVRTKLRFPLLSLLGGAGIEFFNLKLEKHLFTSLGG
jgi:hypothetical protein